MQAVSYKILMILLCMLLLFSCNESTQQPLIVEQDSARKEQWRTLARETFFISEKHRQLQSFVASTQLLLTEQSTHINSNANNDVAQNEYFINEFIKYSNPAVIERQKRLALMYLAHEFTVFGDIELHSSEYNYLKTGSSSALKFTQYIDNLATELKAFQLFQYGTFNWYFVDEQTKVMAYQRNFNNTRAYIAFNFSFDNHEMPMPHGFMSSTKITLWQSDVDGSERFVTQNPLTLRPFTAMIVIVD